jgi:hypothetical protein
MSNGYDEILVFFLITLHVPLCFTTRVVCARLLKHLLHISGVFAIFMRAFHGFGDEEGESYKEVGTYLVGRTRFEM